MRITIADIMNGSEVVGKTMYAGDKVVGMVSLRTLPSFFPGNKWTASAVVRGTYRGLGNYPLMHNASEAVLAALRKDGYAC